MKRKPYPIAQLTKGLNVSLDAVFLTDTESPNLKVIRFDKGLVKKDLGFSSFGTGQRVINGDMEYNGHWANVGSPTNCAQSNTQAHGGSNSWWVRKAATGNEGVVSASFPLAAGSYYVCSAWARSNEAANATMLIYSNSVLQANVPANLVANTWTQLNANITCDTNSMSNQADIRVVAAGNIAADLWVDDVSIECDTPTDERILHFDNLYLSDGTEYFTAFGLSRMYTYESGVWTPVNGSNVFTGDEDDQFSTVNFKDLLIITNGYNPVYKWTGTALSALGGLGSPVSLTAAKAVIAYNSRLVLGNTVEGGNNCPYRVRWSATGEEEHWDPATYPDANFVDLLDTPDWIVGFATLVDRLFVFKERSIWELLPTKDLNIFEARLTIDGVGTYCASSITNLGDALLFFGTDDVYLFDGTSLKSVGEPIHSLLYTTGEKRVNLSKLNRTASVYIEELGDYVLCLPTSGDDPDWLIKYNVNEENWTQRDKSVTAFGYWSEQNFQDWSSATGYWDDPQWARDWKSLSLPPGSPITILALTDNTIEQDKRLDTTTEQMIWESKDFVFAHSQRIVGFTIKCKGNGDFTVYYSTDKGLTWDAGKTFTPDSDEFKEVTRYLNLTCAEIRFRIITVATDFQIMWLEPWYIDRERATSPIV